MGTSNDNTKVILPDHRYLAVDRIVSLGLDRDKIVDSYTQSMVDLYDILEDARVNKVVNESSSSLVDKSSSICYTLLAYNIYTNDTQSAILESLLLTKAEFDVISTTFDIPVEVVTIYESLFFDISSFNGKLGILGYIEELDDGFHKELKRRSYSFGSEFILYRYGNVLPDTESQRNLLKKLFLDSAYRSMEANYFPSTSADSKAALEWSKVMVKASDSLERIFNNEGPTTDSIMIRLKNAQELKLNRVEGDNEVSEEVSTLDII